MVQVFYNRKGLAVAYLDSDKHSIYSYDGTPVAFLFGELVYSYSGKHLGWFINGWIQDLNGEYVFFVKESLDGPVKPLVLIDFFQASPKAKPNLPEQREEPHSKFKLSTSWSSLDEKTFFDERVKASKKIRLIKCIHS